MRALACLGLIGALFGATLLGACQHQTDPIYSPPPGGHDALSKPPPALLQ